MIQKKSFSDAITANIGVVEELLPVVSADKKGLMPSLGYTLDKKGGWKLIYYKGKYPDGLPLYLEIIAADTPNQLASHIVIHGKRNTTTHEFDMKVKVIYASSYKWNAHVYYLKDGNGDLKLWIKSKTTIIETFPSTEFESFMVATSEPPTEAVEILESF